MSSNIAARRAAKAARRKKLLAERRRAAPSGTAPSLAEQVRRLAAAPLHACVLQEGLFEHGNGTLMLARRMPDGRLAVASFLLDAFCLGVKDAFYRPLEWAEFDQFCDDMEAVAPFVPVQPSYARKLLRDLVAYARALGFEPAREYAALEPLFADARAEDCDAAFTFGRDGKPCYIPGPTDTAANTRQRLDQLRRRLGDDGFGYELPTEEPDDPDELEDLDDDVLAALAEADAEDDEDEFADVSGYDPDIAPDPQEWLALDEDERHLRVRAWHRRAGVELPNERIHGVVHVVVENHVAMGDGMAVRRTIRRLMEQDGLSRHDAIHAVGSVFMDKLLDQVKLGEPAGAAWEESYDAELDRLTAESWRRKFAEEEDGDAPQRG